MILFVRIPIFNQSEAWVRILDIRHGPFVVNTIQSFPHSWLIIRFVTKVTNRCHMWSRNHIHFWSTPVHPCGVCVARTLVFCLMSCKSLFSLFSFLLANVFCSPSIYLFWLPIWYLQTFLIGSNFRRIPSKDYYIHVWSNLAQWFFRSRGVGVTPNFQKSVAEVAKIMFVPPPFFYHNFITEWFHFILVI